MLLILPANYLLVQSQQICRLGLDAQHRMQDLQRDVPVLEPNRRVQSVRRVQTIRRMKNIDVDFRVSTVDLRNVWRVCRIRGPLDFRLEINAQDSHVRLIAQQVNVNTGEGLRVLPRRLSWSLQPLGPEVDSLSSDQYGPRLAESFQNGPDLLEGEHASVKNLSSQRLGHVLNGPLLRVWNKSVASLALRGFSVPDGLPIQQPLLRLLLLPFLDAVTSHFHE